MPAYHGGFKYRPEAVVNGLRNLLNNQYTDRDAVIKEIIQNADDAKATEIHIGVIQDLTETDNPLLKSPIIFFMNNGVFTSENVEAICSLGIGDNANRNDTIGQFGLGLKSVFHLGEAFFILSSMQNPIALNPWHGAVVNNEAIYDPYSILSPEDIRRLKERLPRQDMKFCLLVPLRIISSIGSRQRIVDEFFDADNLDAVFDRLFPPEIQQRLVTIMPMLRTLKSITCYRWDSALSRCNDGWSVRFSDGPNDRCRFPFVVNKKISGSISYAGVNSNYAGIEVDVNTLGNEISPRFEALKNNEHWPKVFTIINGDQPVAADPHGMVCLQRLPGNSGTSELRIGWSVFLPVAEVETATMEPAGMGDNFSMTLHGYFLVDSGRREIPGIDDTNDDREIDNTASLQRRWNTLLRDQVVLPLIPQTLHTFNDSCSAEIMTALVKAFEKTNLCETRREAICARHQWVCRITPEAQTAWELVTADSPIIILPGTNNANLQTLFETFPTMRMLVEDNVVVVENSPLISRIKAQHPDDATAAALIAGVPGNMISQHNQRECFCQVIAGISKGPEAQQALVARMRALFCNTPLQELRRATANIKELLALICNGVLYFKYPGLNNQHAEEVFQRLNERVWTAGGRFLAAPAHFRRVDGVNQAPEYQQPEGVAAHLIALAEDNECKPHCADMLCGLLERLEPGAARDSVLQRCGDTELFPVYRPGTSESEPVYQTLNGLHTIEGEGRLFKRSDVLESMQKAVSGTELFYIKSHLAVNLFGPDKVPAGNMEACVAYLLNRRPQLTSCIEQRIPFLKRMLHEPARYRQAIRYVLHGNTDAFDDKGPLFIAVPNGDNVWAKLMNCALQDSNEEWRVIKAPLAQHLSGADQMALGITSISRDGALNYLIGLLDNNTLTNIDFSAYGNTERFAIVEAINHPEQPSFHALQQRLRLHRTTCGTMIPQVKEYSRRPVYLESTDMHIPDSLCSTLYLVQPIQQYHGLRRPIFKSIDAESLLRLIQNEPAPHKFWKDILDIPGNYHSNESRSLLKDMPWLPTTDGIGISPSQILYYPAISQHIETVMADDHYGEQHILAAMQNHNKYDFVRKLYRTPDEMTTELISLFSAAREYATGIAHALSDGETVEGFLDLFLEAFSGVSKNIMRAVELLDVFRRDGHDNIANKVFDALAQQIPEPDRLVEILTYLQSRTGAQKWHTRYLKVVSASGFREEILPRIQLRSITGVWKHSRELCHGLPNVSPVFLVKEEQAEALNLPDSTDVGQDNDTAGNVGEPGDGATLLAYFKPWYGQIPQQQIGLFLSFFSKDDVIKSVAETLLYPHTLDHVWSRVNWPNALGAGVGAGFDIEETIHSVNWRFTESADTNMLVTTITGDIIRAPVNNEVRGILLTPPNPTMVQPYVTLTLRTFDPQGLDSIELKRFLVDALITIFRSAFNRAIADGTPFAAAFEELGKTDQLTLAVTQRMIMRALPFYIRQLGVTQQCECIAECLDAYDAKRRRNAEMQISNSTGNLQDEEEDIKRLTQHIEERHDDVRQSLLKGVQQKMEINQYDLSSVPFELFQNADDAVLQWRAFICEAGEQPSNSPFIVQCDTNTIRFMHWGRPINQHAYRGSDSRKAYQSDLENMLTLNTSNKGQPDANPQSVGKFGLGFKSVFLVADEPRILSGELCFQIVGGLWPMQCDDRDHLKAILQEHNPTNDTPGTIIELANVFDGQSVLERFRSLATLLCVTGQGIQEISMVNGGNETARFSWDPEGLGNDGSIEYGELHWQNNENHPDWALKLNLSKGELILGVGKEGPMRFPKEVPTIWSLAPTRECTTLGLVLNARNLPLDVGRSRIGEVPEELTASLAQELRTRFSNLAGYVCDNWESAKSEWHLSSDLSRYRFWMHFFDYLVAPYQKEEPENKVYALIRDILWPENSPETGGLVPVMQEYPIVPTGLWYAHEALGELGQIACYLKKPLCAETTFRSLLRWPVFDSQIQPGSLVSEEVFRRLNAVGALTDDVQGYDVLALLRECIKEGDTVSSKQATLYGAVVTKDMLAAMEQSNDKKLDALRQYLRTLKFLNGDGESVPCAKLLCKHQHHDGINDDEPRRAAFAPTSRILHPDYNDHALEFFLVCRMEMNADAALLASWLTAADSDEHRKAALDYVLKGELGRRVAVTAVGKGLGNTWIAGLKDSQLLHAFTGYQRTNLLAAFNLLPDSEPPPPPVQPLDASEALRDIWDWWDAHHVTELNTYEQRIYPDYIQAHTIRSQLEARNREAWLTIFILGACHTMGRTEPEQHKGFLDRCKSKGWMDIFANPNSPPKKWIDILEDHIEEQWRTNSHTFDEWMRLFPHLYRLSKWLDEYITAFDAGRRHEAPINSLANLTAPGTASMYQGGGPDAPSIDKVLNIGACFVARELVRHTDNASHHLYPFCFVPSKQLRKFLVLGLGLTEISVEQATADDSKRIYEFLCMHLGEDKATFNTAFDIPFKVILGDTTLKQKVLGRTWP